MAKEKWIENNFKNDIPNDDKFPGKWPGWLGELQLKCVEIAKSVEETGKFSHQDKYLIIFLVIALKNLELCYKDIKDNGLFINISQINPAYGIINKLRKEIISLTEKLGLDTIDINVNTDDDIDVGIVNETIDYVNYENVYYDYDQEYYNRIVLESENEELPF